MMSSVLDSLWAHSSLERRRCEVARGVLAHKREARMDLLRPRQRRLDVRHDVVGADMVDELGLLEELRGLMARAAQDPASGRTSSADR